MRTASVTGSMFVIGALTLYSCRSLQQYSRIVYSWWIIAFIKGGLLVVINKIHG